MSNTTTLAQYAAHHPAMSVLLVVLIVGVVAAVVALARHERAWSDEIRDQADEDAR